MRKPVTEQSRGRASSLPGPIKIACVDLDIPAPAVRPDRPDGSTYASALLLAFRKGLPVGQVEATFNKTPLTPSDVEAALVALRDIPVDDPLSDTPMPRMTVVVPSTLSRITALDRCLASLLAQDYPEFDVIIVDNRPDPSPERAAVWKRLAHDPRVRVVAEPVPGASAARNRGAAESASPIIAFTDDDVEVGPGWLCAIGRRFAREPETDCVTGLILPASLETPAQIWFERAGGQAAAAYTSIQFVGPRRSGRLRNVRPRRFMITQRHHNGTSATFMVFRAGRLGAGASLAIRAEALRAVGGWDLTLGPATPVMAGEDQMLLVTLLLDGRTITFDPAAYVFHTHRETYDDLRQQMYSYGLGYTAMLTANALNGHAMGLMWYAVQAAFLLPKKFLGRWRAATAKPSESATPLAGDLPRELSVAEFRGLAAGPLTYARSQRGRGRSRRTPRPTGA